MKYITDHTIALENDHWGLKLAPNVEWILIELENKTESDNHSYQLSNWDGDTFEVEAKAAVWKNNSEVLILEEKDFNIELVSFYPGTK